MYIIDYVSVFLYLHMLGIVSASITNCSVLVTRFDVLYFLVKYDSCICWVYKELLVE